MSPNTDQIESREHLHLKCDSSVKVLKEAPEAIDIEVNDLEMKGYERLIYKTKENVWEETRENLLLLLYRFYIFKCSAGERPPCTNIKYKTSWG